MNLHIWHDFINFRFLLSTGNEKKLKKKSKLGMIIDLYRTKLLLWTISGSTGYEKFTS